MAGSKDHVPAAKKSWWKMVNAVSKKTRKAPPTATAPIARVPAPSATARQNHRDPRAASPATTSVARAASTTAEKARTTPRTSAMWERSRPSKTGCPATSWAKLPGPNQTSRTMSRVTASTCCDVHPV